MQNALYGVHLASAVYLDDPQGYEYFDDFLLTDLHAYISDENFALIGRCGGALVVALRGTDDARDWWNNFHFGQVDDYNGRVHSGFYYSMNSVWADMIKRLGKLWQTGDVVWIAGHSLGGAMATLAARWLAYEEYDIAGVFTFGQPRVGNNAFADNYPLYDVHYRFVNNKDFVPQVPYRWMGPGIYYQHVGKLYHFDEDGNLSRSDRTWNELVEDFTEDIMLRRPSAGRPEFGFADHAITRYISKIEAALEG